MRAIALALACGLLATAAMADNFTLTSRDMRDGGTMPTAQVFNADGCAGGNRSPQLAWSGAPDGTLSFAVTLFDPDAPTGHGWWHWTVFDIPPDVHSLPEDAGAAHASGLPAGATQGRNDFGGIGYGGPCPPPGDRPHRYVLTVYALNVPRLKLPPGAADAVVAAQLRGAAIATAGVAARYGRPR